MKQNQKGNIFIVILLIIAIIAMIIVYATSGSSNSASASTTASATASTLLSDMTAFSSTAQQQAITNGVGTSLLQFTPTANLSSNLNILATSAPDGIGMPYLTPPGKALNTSIGVTPLAGEGFYVFMANAVSNAGNGVGSAVFVAGVTDAVCNAVDAQLYGSGAGPINSGTSTTIYVEGATIAIPTTGMYSAIATDPIHSKGGCLTTSDGANHNIVALVL